MTAWMDRTSSDARVGPKQVGDPIDRLIATVGVVEGHVERQAERRRELQQTCDPIDSLAATVEVDDEGAEGM